MGDESGRNDLDVALGTGGDLIGLADDDPAIGPTKRVRHPETDEVELWTVRCPYCGADHVHGVQVDTAQTARRAECFRGGYIIDVDAPTELDLTDDRERPGACPACGEPSAYLAGPDRYYHLDGSDNDVCWLKLLRGEVPRNDDELGRYDELYLPRSALAEMPAPEPLIDGILDKRTLFVVSGRDQTYKSFLALGWLCSLATGHDWLGRSVERTKCLYVVGEGAFGLHSRITAWEAAWRAEVEDDWLHVRRAPVNLFKQAAQFQDLLARIQLEGYGVVVFDTLQRMSSGADQNSARDAGVIVESLDRVRQVSGGSVGVVAHSDKGDNDTRGSSAFEDDADLVWRTKRDDEDELIRAAQTKRKDGPDGLTLDLRPKLVPGTGSLVLESARSFVPDPSRPPSQAYPVLRMLGSKSAPAAGLSATPLLQALGLSGRSQLYRALDWLMDAEYVRKVEVGQHPSYKITPEGVSHLAEMQPDQHG